MGTRTDIMSNGLSRARSDDINIVSSFIAHTTTRPLHTPDTVYVLVGNAILHTVKTTLDHLSSLPDPITLVLCGGIGHSTSLLYDAVSNHQQFNSVGNTVKGLSESRVFEILLERFWPDLHDRLTEQRGGSRLLVEDQSTNCGTNAAFTLDLLKHHGIKVERLVVVQDPTMARRTMAGFEKGLEGSSSPCEIINWSTLVPRIRPAGEGDEWFSWDMEDQVLVYEGGEEQLWKKRRFLELVLGEIPRFQAYGPKGTGSIVKVDIPEEVEQAYRRLKNELALDR